MHKRPIDSKFIVASKPCSTKLLPNVGSIRKKCGQVLVQLMTNFFSSFLSLLGRLETNSGLFYDFDKSGSKIHSVIFYWKIFTVFVISVHIFKRVKNHKLIIIVFD